MPRQPDLNDTSLVTDHFTPPHQQKTAKDKSSLAGTMIGGRYLVERELSRGGIGVVYLARDKPELMSRFVVVKVLLEDALRNEWIIQKFHQEIESLTRLDDPGVVGIFDAGILPDGTPYLVMQYVDGNSLRAEIKPGGMGFERVAGIIRQVGRALTVAHDNGIIHRDLKPENIMLRLTTSGEEQVKVIDFGIAKIKNSVIAPSTVTGIRVAGTFGYMSPEQLKAQSVAAASDVYSLGVIAYEMLTGIRPFNPETAFQLLEMQRGGVRALPKDLRPALSETAQGVILKALAFNTERRYQRAQEFSEALSRALFDKVDDSQGLKHKAVSNTSLDRNLPLPIAINQISTILDSPSHHELPGKLKKKKYLSLSIILLAAFLLGGAFLGSMAFWRRDKEALKTLERSLGYSLTVQKMDNKKPVGVEIESTGQELYGNGWKFRLNITPLQAGSLYLLNEGMGASGAKVYNVLFPTPETNTGKAQLLASQNLRTGWFFFDEHPGTEKLWLIWSEQPLATLDSIFQDAIEQGLVISNLNQMNTVRNLLAPYNSIKPQVEVNKVEKLTLLKGKGEVLIHLLEMEHNQY